MSARPEHGDPVRRHLRRLRGVGALGVPVVPLCWWLTVSLEPAPGRLPLTPVAVSVAAGALGLLLALTAERAVGRRLRCAHAAYARDGDRTRLLAAHLTSYLLVLARLGLVAALGPLVALFGTGGLVGSGLVAAAAALMLLAWPSEGKVELLLHRAEEERRRLQAAEARTQVPALPSSLRRRRGGRGTCRESAAGRGYFFICCIAMKSNACLA